MTKGRREKAELVDLVRILELVNMWYDCCVYGEMTTCVRRVPSGLKRATVEPTLVNPSAVMIVPQSLTLFLEKIVD